MSRFDYVKYDERAIAKQADFKKQCEELEKRINNIGGMLDPLVDKAFCSRAKENAIKSLEEVYMWIGKGIRDEQVARNLSGNPPPLQEERNNA